jgi:hypothetical protein
VASFWNVCKVATSVDHPDEVTITTCCALPTLASCCTSSGAGGASVAVFDGACVGDGVGCVGGAVGVGLAAEGVAAGAGGELARFGLARFGLARFALTGPALAGPALAGLTVPAGVLAAADVDAGWPLDAGGWVSAAEEWLVVQPASVNASAAIEAAQAAGVVRSRLPIWSG